MSQKRENKMNKYAKIFITSFIFFIFILSNVNALSLGYYDGYGFEGIIDDLFIYTTPLSVNQILNIFNNNTRELHFNETQQGENWTACVTPNDKYVDGNTNCSNVVFIEEALSVALNVLNADVNLSAGKDVQVQTEQMVVVNAGNTNIDIYACANQSLFPAEGFNSSTFQALINISGGVLYDSYTPLHNLTNCTNQVLVVDNLLSGAGQQINVSFLITAPQGTPSGSYDSTVIFTGVLH